MSSHDAMIQFCSARTTDRRHVDGECIECRRHLLKKPVKTRRRSAFKQSPLPSGRDLTGVLQSWIDIGAPEAPRLHKAGKAARRVAVYAHREVTRWFERLAGERIYRAEALEIYVMDRDLVAALVRRLERRMAFDLSASEKTHHVSMGKETLTGTVELRRLQS